MYTQHPRHLGVHEGYINICRAHTVRHYFTLVRLSECGMVFIVPLWHTTENFHTKIFLNTLKNNWEKY